MVLALVLAVIAAAIAGCNTIPLRTAPAPVAECNMARASGQLVNNRRNGLALRSILGEVRLVLWPFGYTARGFAGSMVLVDETGQAIAREGDFVEMAGGGDEMFVACAGTINVILLPG